VFQLLMKCKSSEGCRSLPKKALDMERFFRSHKKDKRSIFRYFDGIANDVIRNGNWSGGTRKHES
jgi:hypothetical protein